MAVEENLWNVTIIFGSSELQTFNKFAVNIVSINFLGLNIPKIIMWKIHIWKNLFVNIYFKQKKIKSIASQGTADLRSAKSKLEDPQKENWKLKQRKTFMYMFNKNHKKCKSTDNAPKVSYLLHHFM